MWKFAKVSGSVLVSVFLYSVGWVFYTSLKSQHQNAHRRRSQFQVNVPYHVIDVSSKSANLPDLGDDDDLGFFNPLDDGLTDDGLFPKKYLVYVCSGKAPCGGWGDRLRGIISTYVMAKLTNRTFVINMTSPCRLDTFLRPNEVQWNHEVHDHSQSNQIFLETHDNERFAKMLQILDIGKFLKHDIVKLTPNYDLYSRLKLNPRYAKKLSEMTMTAQNSVSLIPYFYRKLFSFTREMEFQIAEFISQLYDYGKRRKLVCFQVRTGRNPSIPRDTKTRMGPYDISVFWKFLEEFKDNERYKIFVTTDSEDIREEAKKKFPDQILDTPGPVTHLDYPPLDGRCEGEAKAILDQYLLKFCDTLVISKSLFGMVGALLRNQDTGLYQMKDGKILQTKLKEFNIFAP